MTKSERLTLAASLVAILISLVNAYFQFFWRDDDLRVQWYFEDTGIPSLVFNPAPRPGAYASIRINMIPTVVFVNTGNQNVTVTDVKLVLLQSASAPVGNIWRNGENPRLSECFDSSLGGALASWQRVAIGNESNEARPIVINAGSSVPVRIWFRQIEEAVDESWQANSEVTTCFSFQLIDSKGRGYTRRIPAMRFTSSGGTGGERETAVDIL
jgi:hypothetical protein